MLLGQSQGLISMNHRILIDLVVDFDEKDPLKYTDLYFGLKTKLENVLNRQVDLLEERSIRNQFFRKHLDDAKDQIYGY